MYTTLTATRDFALKASGAAARAMERSVCCKSQFKFKCFSCGEMIQRGDNITMAHGGEGMTLRFRGSDGRCGLTGEETVFYQPSTGSKRWVHIGCNPCHWHNGGDGYGEARLYGVWTEWGSKISREFDEDYSLTGRWDMEEFLERNGYPQEKYQSDRVKAGVTAFQALWRGYIYKKAYPIALRAARALEGINLNARATMSSTQVVDDIFHPSREAEFWDQWRKSAAATSARCGALWDKWLWSGEGATGQEVPDLITKRQRETHISMSKFFHETKGREGSNTAILFDRGRKKETIYSCEILNVRIEPDAVYVYVRFHYDQERRVYHWRKFQELERECHNFMKNKGIILLEFEGKIPTHRLRNVHD